MAVKTFERLILRLHEDRKIPLFASRPKGSLTSENWHKPYADALMEVEPQRLSRLIVEAEQVIFVRYLELCMNPRPIEISQDLQNAVYALIDLKKSIGNPVVIYEESALTPSMRRPVSVKSFLSFCLFFSFFFFVSSFSKLFPFSQAASVATLPSALFVSDCRSVQGGCT